MTMKTKSSRKKTVPQGSVFGRLTVIQESTPRVYREVKYRRFKCRCACGKLKDYEMSNLLCGRVNSCGCYARERTSENSIASGRPVVTGHVCHMLTLLRETEARRSRSGNRIRRVLCRCECGKEKEFDLVSIQRKQVKCCGCKSALLGVEAKDSHMHSRDPIYKVWSAMKFRCNPDHADKFPNYSGRGITVCERWSNFSNFLDDMGERPEGRWTLERIDNEKGYSRENCRWATVEDQLNNTRKNVNVTYQGVTKSCSQWARDLGVNKKSLTFRVLRGWPVDEIFTRPYTKSNPRKFGRKVTPL